MLKIGLKELTPLSSVAYGDTPLPEEGGFGSTSCSICDTKVNPVTAGSFLWKELRGAVRIGLCRAKAPPKGGFTNDSQ